jgi:hypothetical protein
VWRKRSFSFDQKISNDIDVDDDRRAQSRSGRRYRVDISSERIFSWRAQRSPRVLERARFRNLTEVKYLLRPLGFRPSLHEMGERLADQRVSQRPPGLCQPVQPFPGLFINVNVEVQATSEYNCSICYMTEPDRARKFPCFFAGGQASVMG